MSQVFLARLARLQNLLTSLGDELLVVQGFENISYLTGFSGHAATLLVMPQKAMMITDYRYYQRALSETQDIEVVQRDRDNESLGACIARLGGANLRIGFEAAHFSVAQWQGIASELNAAALTPRTDMVESLRRVKDEYEIDCIRQAAAIADSALAQTLTQIKTGITERELAIELDYQMQLRGSTGTSFDTILLFAERSALPHGNPGNKQLLEGDFILIDFGAVVNGYRSDMTRSYVWGQPSAEQQAIFDTVQNAQRAALDAVRPGVSAHELNAKAHEVLQASPFGQYAGEGLGHGLGLFLHEIPFLKPGEQYRLQAGNVITIEPGIYIPHLGGVRLEEDIVVTAEGYDCLTQAPQQFILGG
ncbi:M24 family metallopeptidase [Pseudoalteromonas sp. T1lg48]|uniref:M24 family metallopeptidase n=1 Tax=Pseudoalteromonas sp. T1lg48 TaxID=2077100 RepID=UPI000CF694A6|nr:Xaa-Pro peptidase family protein [Pseudoalteromonas sp. T1lg48]